MQILVTRPSEDGAQIAVRLAAAGHIALLAPLLETQFHSGPALDLSGVAAILATSANGVRALMRRTARRDVPVFAVGPQTSAEAQAAGFLRVENADGDARALAQAVPDWVRPDEGALLHVCGAQNVGALVERLADQGYGVRREVLYEVTPRPLTPEAVSALRAGTLDAALFFSPRSARIFHDVVGALPVQNLIALAISPATARELASLPFREIRVAPRPNQELLLALLS